MSDASPETWNLTIQTPIGPQTSVATLIKQGSILTGHIAGRMGGEDITQGKIDGDRLRWVNDVQKPAKIKLTFEVQVVGDQLSGKVKMGMFGSFNVNGQRA
ncbi:hypothetical protein [Caulobacter sp. BK020]|uniref:hypothetical protein n=1 Tax=Caulobacter sp. BK020 TaxID=2512117 RepID=UPI001050F506|nr:hypothetical protein [Caulobacter sp. BK020]TCS14935.1 hypothetical protein EV278_106122 [Caulobacter sp. BK020]